MLRAVGRRPRRRGFLVAFLGIVALASASVGCGSSSSVDEFGAPTPTVFDAAETPYPDSQTAPSDAGPADDAVAAGDVPAPPKCPDGLSGKGNVCVRVLRANDGPSINTDSKNLGLDGRGTVLVALSTKPTVRDAAFVTQTWYPSASSGTGKFAIAELPKIAEPLSVPPGKYYVFAVFRDQEPYMRSGLAIGDYVPRVEELPSVEVTENGGFNVDVTLHPVRAVDVEVKLGVAPLGSGAGSLRAWLLGDNGVIFGEGIVPCADLAGGRTATVRVLSPFTGSAFKVSAALFDFTTPTDMTATMPTLPPGTLYNEASAGTAAQLDEGDWLATERRSLALDKVVPMSTPKPTDPSPSCASYALSPPSQ